MTIFFEACAVASVGICILDFIIYSFIKKDHQEKIRYLRLEINELRCELCDNVYMKNLPKDQSYLFNINIKSSRLKDDFVELKNKYEKLEKYFNLTLTKKPESEEYKVITSPYVKNF